MHSDKSYNREETGEGRAWDLGYPRASAVEVRMWTVD